ncbi:MAG: hypothetical protein FD123_1696 [Bacteroidetes bacterium]|nr:MAG: hypothetical protein FD123_1696 [Bacteroidota bacterium]
MSKPSANELILELLKEKSSLKQEVYHQTLSVFAELKRVLKEVSADLKPKAAAIDKRLTIEYKEKSEFELELRVAGDVLIFYMHTNVFEFDKTHPVWKTSYVRDNPQFSYCGQIHVYNFLADSFKYNRVNDLGYLIARIFLNVDKHYFVDGKRQLGFLYNDFMHNVIDKDALHRMVESMILYALDFDLFTPPFDEVKEVSVSQIMEATMSLQLKTAKRLGFRFQADTDHFE